VTAFAILNLPGRRLYRLGLGAPPEIPLASEPHLRWVLDRYGERRDQQWRVPTDEGGILLMKMYYEECADPAASPLLTPILWAFGFYGPAVVSARHLARERMADPSAERQAAAIWALGSFGVAESAEAVWPFLGVEPPFLRRAAVIALAKLADAEGFAVLDGHARGDLELEEIVAVGRARRAALDRKDLPGLIRASLAHEVFSDDLTGMLSFIVRELADLFLADDLTAIERRRAARIFGLGRLSPKRASRAARDIALEPAQPVELRVECIRMLGRVRAGSAAPALIELLEDPRPAVVDAAVTALGELGDSRAIGALLNHYDDREGAVRAQIALAVWRLAQPFDEGIWRAFIAGETDLAPDIAYFLLEDGLTTALPREVVLPSLADPRVEVRREAALLLGAVGTGADVEALAELAGRDDDELTRAVARRAAALAAGRGT
jgi:HEAT repeat protein